MNGKPLLHSWFCLACEMQHDSLYKHGSSYRRFIAGLTLNNSKKEVEVFCKLSLNVVENFWKFFGIFLEIIT